MNGAMGPLGLALGQAILPQLQNPAPPQSAAYPSQKISKGQFLAGILADALAGAAGQPGQFAPMMQRRRQQEQEQAQWGLKRRADLEDYEAKQKIDQRYKGADVPPMLRDVQAYLGMSEPQRQAWQQMNDMKRGDPDVFVTLPNGQVYAGPKSGLSSALMGGGRAPQAPVGKLTPIAPGGQTPPASGGFR